VTRVCVYCGSSVGARSTYAAEARALGRQLVARRIGLVYGGGNVGLMGILADTVMAAGGEVTGVIPRALAAKELAHHGITDLRLVASMHERKALMAELADAFIALPGGLGTLEEIAEAATWTQLGLHRKPCGLLNVESYFDGLLAWLDRAVDDGFVKARNRAIVLADSDLGRLLDRLAGAALPELRRWIGRDEA
jgi:uncharacterized protein (TIGR00730 family)